MDKKIFPKEIIRFTMESHYSRFSKQSKAIYLLLIAMVITVIISLPFLKIDITIQSRGMIRSQSEPTLIQTPITGQVQKICLRENMKVSIGDTLIWLSPDKITEQLNILTEKISLYSSYISDLVILSAGKGKSLQSDLLKSSYAEYSQKLKEYELQIETTNKDFQRTKTLFQKEVIAVSEFEKKELELNQLIKEREYYISQKKSGWNQQLFQYKSELQALTDNRDQLQFEKRFYVVTARNNGYISNYNGIQAGSFIFPNQTIGTIAPSDSLIVECYVSPNDIGYLQIGKQATFQVDAYNYNQWGLADGEIIDISNQLYQEDKSVYFKVKCKLNQNSLFLISGYQGKLKNGLTLTSRFQINRRSLYDLLFDNADDWLNPKIISSIDM